MLSSSELSHIASLAKLSLEPEEAAGLASDLSRVLDYIALLDEVDVSDAESEAPSHSAVRADVARPGMDVQHFLDNAPERLDRFLLVPAIK